MSVIGKGAAFLALVLAAGCSSLYIGEGLEEGDFITINVTGDTDKLYSICGAEACARLYEGGKCTIWLPERASENLILHEISHCWGRVDAPEGRGNE